MVNQKKAQARAERNAALQEEQRRKAKRGMILRAVAVAAALVAIAAVLFAVGRSGGDEAEGTAGESEYGITMGDPDAPHQVVIYEDFLCPFCGELERASGEELQQLADDGKVFVDYRPFALLERIGPYSADATNAMAVVQEESDEDVAIAFHQLLFENQPEESAAEFPGAEELIALAVEAGADEDAVRPGIENDAMADWVEGATTEALEDNGVEGTPTIMLDGEVYENGGSMDEIADNLVGELS